MKKRIDFLPNIGQALVTGMRAETVAAIDAGKGNPSYCLQQLFQLAGIPLDFQRRWSNERAIQDVLIKARDYGFVDKGCGGRWMYVGPEVKVAQDRRDKRRKAAKTKIARHLQSKGLGVERDSINVDHRGQTTARVVLPKGLWIR